VSRETNLTDFAGSAQKQLQTTTWDYYDSGADDEECLRRNRAGFAALSLHYRVLRDVASRTLETRLLGRSVAMPVGVAPTAFHRLAHPQGEIASARAAHRAGIQFVLSTLSTQPVETVCAAAPGSVWFQLYVYKDRALTEALIRRVESAGARALVLTVDAPVLGKRERDIRNTFCLPDGLRIENMLPAGMAGLPSADMTSGLATYFASLLDPSLSWGDLDWLRSVTRLPLIIKGIVRADDARRAIDHGARGVWVSNHGGRQLDASPATISVLPGIAQAVDGRGEIYLDGGVRRGTDVVKALALGAHAVFLGRPILWALATDGEAGIGRMLGLLSDELSTALALCGATSVSELDRELIFPVA
jgi:4-hydroxymandelate oxidase